MAINLVHRPDLDDRVENLAARLGLKGRGRKTAIIERALTALEEQQRVAHPDPTAIAASLWAMYSLMHWPESATYRF